MTEMNLVQAINRTLHDVMRNDPNVLVLGEDVGVNGGVFRATDGLYKEFGADRVIDTPLSETGIIGAAIGMALYGLKPIAEIQSWTSSIRRFSTRSSASSRSSGIVRGANTPPTS